MENKVRVFLADSQVVFREGMHFILEGEDDVEVVGEGSSAQEAMAFLQEHPIDVLVLEGDRGNTAGLIAEEFPSVGLILIGNSDAGQHRFPAGKLSFLRRDLAPADLAAAIRRVYRGNGGTSRETPAGKEDLRGALREHFLSLVERL